MTDLDEQTAAVMVLIWFLAREQHLGRHRPVTDWQCARWLWPKARLPPERATRAVVPYLELARHHGLVYPVTHERRQVVTSGWRVTAAGLDWVRRMANERRKERRR